MDKRRLVGYSPWCHKESDTKLSVHTPKKCWLVKKYLIIKSKGEVFLKWRCQLADQGPTPVTDLFCFWCGHFAVGLWVPPPDVALIVYTVNTNPLWQSKPSITRETLIHSRSIQGTPNKIQTSFLKVRICAVLSHSVLSNSLWRI